MTSPPVLDPSPEQIRAAAGAWHDDEATTAELSAGDVQVLRAVLTAATPYAALCVINGIDPDARGRWEFPGDSYRRVAEARAAAAAVSTAPPTRSITSTSGPAAERSTDMSQMQTRFSTAPAGSGGQSSGFSGGGLIRGDVTSVGRLRDAAQQADALAEQVQIILGMVHTAAASLPDRLTQAEWGTEGITAAGDGIGDAVGGRSALDSQALDGLLEQLDVMDGEVTSAEQLGAEVLARRADGQAQAFVED